jgi:Ca2+-binding EF-hand superfamily protein
MAAVKFSEFRRAETYDEQMAVYEGPKCQRKLQADVSLDPAARGKALLEELFAYIDTENIRVVEVFFRVDTDGSGELDVWEFEHALTVLLLRPVQFLVVLQGCGSSRQNRLTHQQLTARATRTAAQVMLVAMDHNDLRLAFAELDEDGGGSISIEEFMTCYRRYHRMLRQKEQDRLSASFAEGPFSMKLNDYGRTKSTLEPWMMVGSTNGEISQRGRRDWDKAVTRQALKLRANMGGGDEDMPKMSKEVGAPRPLVTLLSLGSARDLTTGGRVKEYAMRKEEAEAQIAEMVANREEEEAEAAEAVFAKEEEEAELAERDFEREEAEAIQAKADAERENEEAVAALQVRRRNPSLRLPKCPRISPRATAGCRARGARGGGGREDRARGAWAGNDSSGSGAARAGRGGGSTAACGSARDAGDEGPGAREAGRGDVDEAAGGCGR